MATYKQNTQMIIFPDKNCFTNVLLTYIVILDFFSLCIGLEMIEKISTFAQKF